VQFLRFEPPTLRQKRARNEEKSQPKRKLLTKNKIFQTEEQSTQESLYGLLPCCLFSPWYELNFLYINSFSEQLRPILYSAFFQHQSFGHLLRRFVFFLKKD
jgi:hypothetical protein